MMRNAKVIRRMPAHASVVLLPLLLAGCEILFPPRHGMGGAAPTPVAGASASPANGTAPAAMPAEKTARRAKADAPLFERLGGLPGITAFSDDFLGRVTNDPVIIPFFKGLTDADLARIRQHVIELLCSATGGGCTYSGKDMKTVHKDMEINNDSWNAFTGHLNETVARFKIGDRERNELVVIIASLKKDIVNR
jgi:hemoglobin